MTPKNSMIFCFLILAMSINTYASEKSQMTGSDERRLWVNTLIKIVDPVLSNLANAVNPSSPDYLDFQIWGKLDKQGQENLIAELKSSRSIKPFQNNWLLFASIIEATLLELTGECDQERLLYGVEMFRDKWYIGDATYGDGPHYHADYYNSFVIHPLLTEILCVMEKHHVSGADFLPVQVPKGIQIEKAILLNGGKEVDVMEITRNEYNVSMPDKVFGEPSVIKLRVRENTTGKDKYMDALT